jgi:hypothetical protein
MAMTARRKSEFVRVIFRVSSAEFVVFLDEDDQGDLRAGVDGRGSTEQSEQSTLTLSL